MAAFDSSRLRPVDWVGVVAGAITLLVSFFVWRYVDGPIREIATAAGLKSWYTAWGSGFTGWFPVVLLIGSALLLLAQGAGRRVPWLQAIWLVAAFIAVLLIVVRWITLPEPDAALLARFSIQPDQLDSGAGLGLYLGLVAGVFSLVAAVVRVKTTPVGEPTEPITPSA